MNIRFVKQEDSALKAAVAEYGPKNWKSIATEWLGGCRTDVQCVHRWQKVLRPGLVKGNWSAEEDATIVECMQNGVTKWATIAEKVPGRIGKQCRERWFNHLDPALLKGDWTQEEDLELIKAQAELNNAWTKIAKRLNGRSENSCKNRWNSAPLRRLNASLKNGEEPPAPPAVPLGGPKRARKAAPPHPPSAKSAGDASTTAAGAAGAAVAVGEGGGDGGAEGEGGGGEASDLPLKKRRAKSKAGSTDEDAVAEGAAGEALAVGDAAPEDEAAAKRKFAVI